jgi:hypothetical protein
MSSNDDDRPGDEASSEERDRVAPDRQWVLRPNQGGAPDRAADDEPSAAPAPAPPATPAPPVPPPGAPGPAAGREGAGSGPAGRPTIAAQQTPAPGAPASPAPPATAQAGSGPVQSWGSQPQAPVAPAAPAQPARPTHLAPRPTQLGGAADPPTLTPADSPTAAPPVSRSSSPTNVTLGPAQRNLVPPQAVPPAQPQPAPQPQQAAPAPARAAAPGPRGPGKGGPTFADLAQQLAATQAQVAALSAQLTTLAHRLTYDVERGAQTTSERVTRDLERTLAEAVALRVGQHLGPAVDDLTDQIAEDFAPKLEQVVESMGKVTEVGLDARIGALTDAIDSLPMGNVEVLGQLETLGSDLQDRLQRFSTRVLDQVSTLERSNVSELTRLREAVEELKTAGPSSAGGTDVETLRRIANHVERLAQRTPGTAGIVAAVETLITEHLESVRVGLDEQVAGLAPTMQVELDAVRTENMQALGSIEHELLEQISTIEASLIERLDGLLADHLDSVDAVIADRQEGIVEAVATAGGERIDEAVSALTDVGAARLEEVAAVANLGADRVEELAVAVQELQAAIAEGGLGDAPSVGDDAVSAIEALMSTVVEELQALRQKISEQGSGGLDEDQIQAIASAVIKQIRAERAEAAQSEGAHLAKPRRGRG